MKNQDITNRDSRGGVGRTISNEESNESLGDSTPTTPGKVLVLTVGGSDQPVVSSLKSNAPDRAYFVCSADTASTKGSYTLVTGQGRPCKARPWEKKTGAADRPNILVQAGWDDPGRAGAHEVIEIKEFDNLDECHARCLKLLVKVRERYPTAELVVDYTGGTKSMSAGLAAAALELGGVTFCVMRGTRPNLHKVMDGTQRRALHRGTRAELRQALRQARAFARKYEFAAAREVLQATTAHANVPEDLYTRVTALASRVDAAEAWDTFDHARARDLLTPHAQAYWPVTRFLEAVIAAKAWLSAPGPTGIPGTREPPATAPPPADPRVLPWDLYWNARRRAKIGRYDDAVARLYRTLELIAQVRLKAAHGIDTGRVPASITSRVSREYAARYLQGPASEAGEASPYKIGLVAAYELLGELEKRDAHDSRAPRAAPTPPDPLVEAFQAAKDGLRAQLQARNDSILAHGFVPVDQPAYERFDARVATLLEAIAGERPAQPMQPLPDGPPPADFFTFTAFFDKGDDK